VLLCARGALEKVPAPVIETMSVFWSAVTVVGALAKLPVPATEKVPGPWM
jgi:hypothetical protein